MFLLMAFLALVVLVIASPHQFVYDEPYFANYIPLLHQYGLTKNFLNSLSGTVGPLYAFIHVLFEPVTNLQPVKMRLVNVLLLVTIAGILAVWLKQQQWGDYGVSACSVLVVPMTWVLAGMALSEMAAMAFVTLSLYLQLRGLETTAQGKDPLWWFLASGICLGIGVWGRQPYLLLVGVPLLIGILERRLRIPAFVFAAAVLAFAIPLFVIWKGLVPPSHRAVQQGLSLTHGLISLCCTGVCFLLLAPRLKWLPVKIIIVLLVLTGAVNASLNGFVLYPIRSVVDRYLPAPAVSAYGNLCGSLFLSCGVVFLAVLLRTIWDGRKELKLVTVNVGLLCVAASPLFVAHQYSSRYTAMSLPYLVLAAQPLREWRLKTFITAVVGCGIGFVSLRGYFSS